MFKILYRCAHCRKSKQHPSMLRSIPYCDDCRQPMDKVVCPHCGENADHDGYCGVC